MAVKQNRLMITLSDESMRKLQLVHRKTGMSKSSQIQSLIAKYLLKEYEIEGEVHESK